MFLHRLASPLGTGERVPSGGSEQRRSNVTLHKTGAAPIRALAVNPQLKGGQGKADTRIQSRASWEMRYADGGARRRHGG